jgi:tetratricopeptide (TPR) repeat protein
MSKNKIIDNFIEKISPKLKAAKLKKRERIRKKFSKFIIRQACRIAYRRSSKEEIEDKDIIKALKNLHKMPILTFKRKTGSANDYAAIGDFLRMIGCQKEALSCLDKALEVDPNHAWACERRGAVLRGMGKHNEAAESLEKSVYLNGGNAWAYTELGEVYRKQGRYDDAIKNFDMAIKINNRLWWAWERKGRALREYDNKLKLDEAKEAFEQSLKIRPNNSSYIPD